MSNLNLKENETLVLENGEKYWIVKKVIVGGFDVYYTIKLGDDTDVVIFADNGAGVLNRVTDENVINTVTDIVAASMLAGDAEK